MIGRALNKDNDLIVGSDGRFKTVSEGVHVVQSIRTRLMFFRGEWFLDTQSGIPYFEEVFTKPANLANIESIFKSEILNTPNVSKLNEFSMSYEGGASRVLTISFSAETSFGTISNEKVTINV